MESTAFNRDAFYQAAWNPCIHHAAWTPLHTIGIHCATRHGILCIQSGCFGPCCIKSTTFNHAALNPLHSIRLYKIHCIQYGSITSHFMEYSAFNHASWNPLHSIGIHFTTLHGVTAFNHNAWNPLHSIGMLWAMPHKIHCIQRRCMESTEFNWDTLY